jgi:hypothetical protein
MCDYTFTYIPEMDGWKMPTTNMVVSRELLNSIDNHHATSILTMWCQLPVPAAVASTLKNIPHNNPLHFDW